MKDFSSATRKWVGSKRFSIYLYCVFISTFIWFLMKFSGSFTSQLPVKITYVAPSSDWYIVDEQSDIMVDVSGFGFSLMWYKLSGTSEIEINLSNFEMKGDETEAFVVIPSDFLLNKIGQLFNNDETIDGLYPNILKVDMSHAITKSVPIRSSIYLAAKNGFKLKSIGQLTPDKVILAGPAHILSDVAYINTEVDSIFEIEEDRVMMVNLNADSLKEWMTETGPIELKIDVDELTSGNIEVVVAVKSDDPQLTVKVLPNRVRVFYQVGLSDYEKVNESIFKAYVTFSEEEDLPEKLKVKMSNTPNFVEITRVSPPYVEYLISKKE